MAREREQLIDEINGLKNRLSALESVVRDLKEPADIGTPSNGPHDPTPLQPGRVLEP
jgi:hypothetical protein